MPTHIENSKLHFFLFTYVIIIWLGFCYFLIRYISGPAVVVGVTLYVLSISSLSEVEMVLRKYKNVIFKITNTIPNFLNGNNFTSCYKFKVTN